MQTSITPAATDEEAAAIAAAVELLWPRPVTQPRDDSRAPVWRFSGRWWSQPIPLRRALPWV
jgi:hypothetical protein